MREKMLLIADRIKKKSDHYKGRSIFADSQNKHEKAQKYEIVTLALEEVSAAIKKELNNES